eukprot:CAMPEP_0119081560 /NCGR_PEP_ID=MMETSP1178-20130426/117421_1 /TAXON_ID=33656 /ORGANISM="unid sp, Strain CCMP2000" /LENGTH=100 /DNA_ID=CAMNT_0007064269 /DNA_START=52 /DNA_END=355 /DNA_ORIENTATION=-
MCGEIVPRDQLSRPPSLGEQRCLAPLKHIERHETDGTVLRRRQTLNSLVQSKRLCELHELWKDVRHEVQLVHLGSDEMDVLHDALSGEDRTTIEALVRCQ